MIRKSNYSKTELLAGIGEQVQAFQDATDEVDEAVARRLRVNRTDLRCLSVLSRVGTMTASALADAAGLTRGAMTTVLDRLERAGYAKRVWDRQDRRSVRVEMTDVASREVEVLYAPLAKAGFQLLTNYTTDELKAVLRYLEDGRQLQRAQAQRIRELSGSEVTSGRLTGHRGTQPTKAGRRTRGDRS
jgi:DNA-binding MarR family transcriptional regulator